MYYCYVKQNSENEFLVRCVPSEFILFRAKTRKEAEEYAVKYANRRRRDKELEEKYEKEKKYF